MEPRTGRRLGRIALTLALTVGIVVSAVGIGWLVTSTPTPPRMVSCTLDVTPPDCHLDPEPAAPSRSFEPTVLWVPILLIVGILVHVVLWEVPRLLSSSGGPPRTVRVTTVIGGFVALGALAGCLVAVAVRSS